MSSIYTGDKEAFRRITSVKVTEIEINCYVSSQLENN